ncbi:MAG: hypothetical protein V4617_17925 [Gemmatimonadota bacterium]
MLHARALLVLMAPLLLGLGASSAPGSASAGSALRKCRTTIQKEPVFFLDGRVSSDTALKSVDQSDLLTIEVICLNPADSTRMLAASSAAGLGAIIVWTRFSPYPHLEPTLAGVKAAQQAHHAATGKYTTDLAALKLPALPAEVKLSIDTTASGWNAKVWIDRRLSPECRVSVDDGSRSGIRTKGTIVCS